MISKTRFDIKLTSNYYPHMDRKALTVRINPKLYKALSTLSGVVHRSMNDLVTEAVSRFVVSESKAAADDLERTLTNLRAYTEQDPGFDDAIARFAEAESTIEDPLEGKPYRVARDEVRRHVESLLTDA